MIDKPHGWFDKALYAVCDWFHEGWADWKEIVDAGREPVDAWLDKHKPLRGIIILILVGLIGYWIFTIVNIPKQIIVVEENSYSVTTTNYSTKLFRIDRFMEENHIEYAPETDKINVRTYDLLKKDMVIEIAHPFVVRLNVDGMEYEQTTFGITTRELLDAYKVELREYDKVSHDLDASLAENDLVVVNRITVEFVEKYVETPYEVKYVKDNNLVIGDTRVKQLGKKGIKTETYLTVTMDGKVISSTLTNSVISQQKQDCVINYGMKILKGTPTGLEYINKIEKVKAYSYTYKTHRFGVYGLWCSYGTVAVDRKVIPLGSKLYITGYGYAIANDVGSSIKGNVIDLYMEKWSQCSKWGARNVTVYVLEEGDNTRYWERWKRDESLKVIVDGILQYPYSEQTKTNKK